MSDRRPSTTASSSPDWICPTAPAVPARFNKVVDTSLATVIGMDGFIVSTIEHMMAALAGLSIDNALVLVDNYELPIMDGSAGPFARMLQSAGRQVQSAPRIFLGSRSPSSWKKKGNSWAPTRRPIFA